MTDFYRTGGRSKGSTLVECPLAPGHEGLLADEPRAPSRMFVPRGLGYAAALAVVAAAIATHLMLGTRLGGDAAMLLLTLAVAMAAYTGGLGPGLAATALGSLVALVVVMEPLGFAVEAVADWVRLAVFASLGLVITAMSERLHRVRAATESAARDLERQVAQRTVDLREANERLEQRLAARSAALVDIERRFRLTFDEVPALISYIDSDYRYQLANLTYERWFGDRVDRIVGAHVREVLGEAAWEAVRPRMEAALAGETVSFQEQLPYRDGARWVHVVYTPDRDSTGRVRGFVVLVTDIGERIASEERLRSAKVAVETASKAKDHFLAVLSHELRTPLTPVLTMAQLLEREPSLPAAVREDLKTIRRNVELETRLIDDLLDLTRISRGKMQLQMQDLDLHDKLRHVIGICDADVRGKQIALQADLRATAYHVRGDPARLQQVLWNLLKNAVKFTPFGGRVAVRTQDGPDGHLVLTVSDSGVGIEPEILPRLFNAFEQGHDDVTRQFGGLGLGLSIAKGLVQMHGGTIAAASDGIDRGATFTLTLPTTVCPAAAAAGAARGAGSGLEAPGGAAGAGRVLLVEDHADTSRIMSRILRGAGYDVRAADSVSAALRCAEAESFDVVVSDIGLPDGSGLDLMRQLRGLCPQLHGIALSGFGMEEDIRRSRSAGFDEHLTKPIDLPAFEEALKRLAAAGAAAGR